MRKRKREETQKKAQLAASQRHDSESSREEVEKGSNKRMKMKEESQRRQNHMVSLSDTPNAGDNANSPKREENNLDDDMTTQIGDGQREEGTTSNNNLNNLNIETNEYLKSKNVNSLLQAFKSMTAAEISFLNQGI